MPGLELEGEHLAPHHLHPHPQSFVLLQALAQMQPEGRAALREQLTDFCHGRLHQHVHDGQELGLQVQAARGHVCRHVSAQLAPRSVLKNKATQADG